MKSYIKNSQSSCRRLYFDQRASGRTRGFDRTDRGSLKRCLDSEAGPMPWAQRGPWRSGHGRAYSVLAIQTGG